MRLTPGLNTVNGGLTAVVVRVPREPFGLAGALARRFAGRRIAVTLMSSVTGIRVEAFSAIQASALSY
jgi:hypothetical protein